MDRRPVRRFRPDGPGSETGRTERGWPFSVSAIAQIERAGFELPAGLPVLVG